MLSGNFLESLSDTLRAVASSLFQHRVHRPDQEQHPISLTEVLGLQWE